jgi:hypothetical protein
LDLYKQSLLSQEDHAKVTAEVGNKCDELLKRSEDRPVFVKDMAYHAEPFISDEFIQRVKHTFLIRDPSLSIPSLYRMRAYYAEAQTGFEGQLALFQRIKRLTSDTPFVMDAELLVESPTTIVRDFFTYIEHPMPEGILSWQAGSRQAWAERETWHLDAINSTGFVRSQKIAESTQLPRKVIRSIELNVPHYTALLKHVNPLLKEENQSKS